MTLTIRIDVDNDAFAEDLTHQVAGCLAQVILSMHQNETGGPIRDTNGNTVGQWDLAS